MPTDLNTVPLRELEKLVAYPGDKTKVLETNRAYFNGDHWQNGTAWGGPWPTLPEGAKRQQQEVVTRMQQEIFRHQVTVNAIKEVVEREQSGTIGIEPRWSFTPDGIKTPTPGSGTKPTPEETAIAAASSANADRANALATGWWDAKGAHEHLQRFADKLLYGAGPETEASIRLFIPRAMLEEQTDVNGVKTKKLVVRDIEDALSKIHIETLDADQGRVVQDPDTLAEVGIKLTKRGEEQVAEITYLDSSTKRTVLATVGGTARASIPLDLGGRLTMFTAARRVFITEQIRQSQNALNFAAFVVRRNNETAGFLQDTILNAEIPGHYEGEGDARKYVADPIERGPLSLNAFKGLKIKNEEGDVIGMTTPAIDHRLPVGPDGAITSQEHHYADILGACSQRHVLMSGDAIAAAASRIQARGEHIKSLRITMARVQRAGRWLIETVMALADALANGGNSSGLTSGLRLTFACVLDAGPVTPEERAQNISEMNAGAKSKTSTIEQNGTIDVDAELARIDSEPTAGLDAELKRAQIYAAWIAGGVGEEFAGERAGLSPEEIAKLTTTPTDTTLVTQ